jgi:membrane protein DedA with SNARE-associated domain
VVSASLDDKLGFWARRHYGEWAVARLPLPLAGPGGPPPPRFFAANLLGATCYVPWSVLAGYGVGYDLGNWIERLRHPVGLTEDVALFAAILTPGVTFVAVAWAR